MNKSHHKREVNTGKIIAAKVGVASPSIFGPLPKVTVSYEDGEEEVLFSFYPDEISFIGEDFVGLYRTQAYDLKTKKELKRKVSA